MTIHSAVFAAIDAGCIDINNLRVIDYFNAENLPASSLWLGCRNAELFAQIFGVFAPFPERRISKASSPDPALSAVFCYFLRFSFWTSHLLRRMETQNHMPA